MLTTLFSHFLRRLLLLGAMAVSASTALAQVAGCPMPPVGSQALVKTGLPVVEIYTNAYAPVLDRETYVKGCMRLTDGSVQTYGTGLYQGALEIRGRGNSTWDMPKKGYRLKLASPGAPVLNMPAERDWVLLANYADKTLMRAAVGFELSRRLGMAWTPRMRYVDLYLNGEFQGNYLLGEHVKVAPNRVNVSPMLATDISEPNVGGGYLVEADFLEYTSPTDIITYTSSGILFNIKAPGPINQTQVNYIGGYLQRVENALLSDNFSTSSGYPALIDTDTFIDWWIVKELVKDVDGPFRSSVYLYKDRNGKLKMGPLWDFDLSSGNVDYSTAADPTGWRIRVKSEWFLHLFKDKAFRAKVYDRWKALKANQIDTILPFIDQTEAALDASQRENFKRWDILGTYVWPNAVVLGSYPAEVGYLRDWLETRIRWMDKNIKR
jgi:CotH kinase protein